MKYRTAENDEVDYICWKQYGRTAGTVEAVLEANPGLADYGRWLPAGLEIELPPMPAPAVRTLVRLWD